MRRSFRPTTPAVISLGLLLTAAWMAAPPFAWGGTILVDFTDDPSSASTLGGTWNAVGVAGAPAGTLMDATGSTASDVAIAIAFYSGVNANDPLAGTPWENDNDWVDAAAVAKTVSVWAPSIGDTGTVTISGLTPGAGYQVDYVAARSTDNGAGPPPLGRTADYQANSLFADSFPNGVSFNAKGDGWTGGDILTWNNVAADPSGNIVLSATNVGVFPAPGGTGNGLYATALRITGEFATSPISTLAIYEFTGGVFPTPYDFAATNVAAGMSAGDMSIGAGLTGGDPYVYASTIGQSGAGIGVRSNGTGDSEAGAVAGEDYLSSTIAPDAGFELDLAELTFDLTWSNNSSPTPATREIFLRSSADGFAGNLGTFTAFDAGSGTPDPNEWEKVLVDLSAPAFQGLTTPTEFRLYMYDGSDSSGNVFRLDNVAVRGLLTPAGEAIVPEPSTLALGFIGLLGLAWCFWRGRK